MSLTLTSPTFEDGQPIPREYGHTERNVNPPLSIEGVPDDAAPPALIVDDPDAVEPAGAAWDHRVVWNVDPETTDVSEDWDASTAGAVEGQNDFGGRGYGEPNPPDGEHIYRLELYALGTELDLAPDSTTQDVRTAAEGSFLDRATLTGTFVP